MTAGNKAKALEKIESMRPQDMTNLWHGIRDGLSLFTEGGSTGRVPALLVLTDGMPNHMCPQMGYVPKLRTEKLPASIHTFGFGYTLDSGLLKSIAEVGNGNYSFIPDAGMIVSISSPDSAPQSSLTDRIREPSLSTLRRISRRLTPTTPSCA